MNTEGMLSTDDKEAADVLSNKFQQAFTNHGTQTDESGNGLHFT